MKVPYSIHEAEILCNEFQHLKGTFSEGINATVEQVIITPFDQPSKQRFFLYYHLFDNDAHTALTHEYKGLFFDVMIVARNPQDEYVYEDLNSWFCKNNFEVDGYPACPIPGRNITINYV